MNFCRQELSSAFSFGYVDFEEIGLLKNYTLHIIFLWEYTGHFGVNKTSNILFERAVSVKVYNFQAFEF